MKEIKFLLLCLYVSAYTSIFWIAILSDAMVVKNNDFDPAWFIFCIWSALNIILAGFYICNHWKDTHLFNKDNKNGT